MEERSVDDISYIFKELQKSNDPKPIIFLGAGASSSAGIPLTGKIVEDVLEKFKDKPSIKRLSESEKTNYYKLMGALSAQERRELFYNYISNENVKLNVTNIYLAQFLKKGLIDYILTVNFDDLILKACAMFNFIPPVYDVAILNDFTTTTFLEKSVTYLHGQHHGQWLLNIDDELKKVKYSVLNIFKSICNKRTWIIIGYSGEDTVFDNICKLGSFQNDLYWVGYKNLEPSKHVKEKLLEKPRTNAYWVKGYDSDSFFLKLHSSLNLHTPEIFNKPFSFLEAMINNVKDIDSKNETEHKELFENVKERMDISKKWVKEAITSIEQKHSIEKLKQEIIEAVLKDAFSEDLANYFESENIYAMANLELSYYYLMWGYNVLTTAKEKKDKSIYQESFLKFSKSVELNPKNPKTLLVWGDAIFMLAELTNSESLLHESIEKISKAADLNPNDPNAYNNWGNSLAILAKFKKDENLYLKSFLKFQKATQLDPSNGTFYANWGTALSNLARQKKINHYSTKAS